MNAHAPPAQFEGRINPLEVWFARAEALAILVHEGEINPIIAIDELIDPFLAIVGSAPNPCPICGDPPCRHDPAWCAAVQEGEKRRAAEREAFMTKEHRAASSTVELMYSLRERGTAALAERDTRRRIGELSEEQLHQVSARCQALKLGKGPWSADDIGQLVETWAGCHAT
jgi:hypothetical protein